MKEEKFKVINFIRELVIYIDKYLDNFPKKDIEKNRIRNLSYDLLELAYKANITKENKTYSIKIVSDGIYMHSDKLTKIVDWGKCNMKQVSFDGCTNLVEIATPHKESFGTADLGGCFADCTSLKQVPADFFVNIPYIEGVAGMFYNCTSLTGSAIELWNNNKIKYYDGCYYGCTNLSNYDKIPEDWKKDVKKNE